jgi:putative transcriptional regulator
MPMRLIWTVLFAVSLLLAGEAHAGRPQWTGEPLSAGSFLLASPHLRDPSFYQTVVLLLTYGKEGASGLIVNRPTEIPLNRAFPHVDGVGRLSRPIYFGGPVGTDRMIALLRSDTPLPDAKNVLERIYFTASMKNLTDALQSDNPDRNVRVYAGYAGWSPMQLDREFARGDWVTMEADPDAVFSEDPTSIWSTFFERREKIEIRFPEAIPPFQPQGIAAGLIGAFLASP